MDETNPYGTSMFGEKSIQQDPFGSSEIDHPRTVQTAQGEVIAQQPRHAVQNRLRAADLADRGIPTYRDSQSGDVKAVRDETGAALTNFDSAHGIAFDSAGKPQSISYGETGGPKLADPFADMPVRTDKEGNQFKAGRGLYQWQGTDAGVVQANEDKVVQKLEALHAGKQTLDEYDLKNATKEHKALSESLVEQVPTLSDPKFQKGGLDSILKGIDDHFDAQYAADDANDTKGWFGSGGLSPAATARRAEIDAAKQKAKETAISIKDLSDKGAALTEEVANTHETVKVLHEQRLAHAEGRVGPLDAQPVEQDSQLYPPVEHWAKILGKSPDQAPGIMKAAATDGTIPAIAAPAAVAAAHEAADAKKKADELRDSNPTLADQFEAAAKGILTGIGNGVAEIVKGPLGQGLIALHPASWAAAAAGKGTPEELAKKMADAITAGNPKIAKRLEGTVGGTIGNFAGGIIPYVAAEVASAGAASPAVLGSLFFSSGYQHTLDDAKAHGHPDAQGAALTNGAINALLAFPLKTVGKAYEAIFGDTAPKVIMRSIQNAYEHGGGEAIGNLVENLKKMIATGEKPVLEGAAQDVRAQTIKGFQDLRAEITKTPAQRLLDVAKSAAGGAAVGAGVQTAQNIVSKSYNPEQGTFEGVAQQAIGFGALAGAFKGWEQVNGAIKAKKALDILANRGKPGGPALGDGTAANPPTPGSGPGPGGTTPRPKPPVEKAVTGTDATVKAEQAAATKSEAPTPQKGAGKTEPAVVPPRSVPETKSVPEKTATRQTEPDAVSSPQKVSVTELALAEKNFVEKGGHSDRLDGQNKLAALQKAFPDPAARLDAINKHLEPTVDQAAHEAATSPKNDKPIPSMAQHEADNAELGHSSIAGMPMSFENPEGSIRTNVDMKAVRDLAQAAPAADGSNALAKQIIAAHAAGKETQVANLSKVLARKHSSIVKGAPWANKMTAHYGRFKGIKGVDGDLLDAFVKPGTPSDYSGPVHVIDQHDAGGKFDEHKVVLGVQTDKQALALYNSHYPAGWKGGHAVRTFASPAEFKTWAGNGPKGPATSANSAAAVPEPPPGERVVTVRKADGSTYTASFGDKYWETKGGKKASIARLTPEGKWSHGILPEGETIVEKAVSEPKNAESEKSSNEPAKPKSSAKGNGTESAPEPSKAKPGDGKVDGNGERVGSPTRKRVQTADEARGGIVDARRTHAAEAATLQVLHAEAKIGHSGIGTTRDGSTIRVDHEALAKMADAVWQRGGDSALWIQDAYKEELIHVRDFLVSGHEFDKIHAALWKDMSPEAQEATRKLYPDTTRPIDLAAEFVRMVAQFREQGRITESHFRDASISGTLFGEQPAAIEAHLRQMAELVPGVKIEAPAPALLTLPLPTPAASSLDAETQQAMKDAFKDLFASQVKSEVMIHEVDRDGALVLRPNEPSVGLLREYSHSAGWLRKILDCLGK